MSTADYKVIHFDPKYLYHHTVINNARSEEYLMEEFELDNNLVIPEEGKCQRDLKHLDKSFFTVLPSDDWFSPWAVDSLLLKFRTKRPIKLYDLSGDEYRFSNHLNIRFNNVDGCLRMEDAYTIYLENPLDVLYTESEFIEKYDSVHSKDDYKKLNEKILKRIKETMVTL